MRWCCPLLCHVPLMPLALLDFLFRVPSTRETFKLLRMDFIVVLSDGEARRSRVRLLLSGAAGFGNKAAAGNSKRGVSGQMLWDRRPTLVNESV